MFCMMDPWRGIMPKPTLSVITAVTILTACSISTLVRADASAAARFASSARTRRRVALERRHLLVPGAVLEAIRRLTQPAELTPRPPAITAPPSFIHYGAELPTQVAAPTRASL